MENVCNRCGKGISENESKLYNNECRGCYSSEHYSMNKTAIVIRVIAVIEVIAGIIYAIILGQSYYADELVAPVIVGSIIIAVFVYGFGEIIQKLQNIEDNTKK